MARINIEDSIWGDPRFQDLMIKVGRHAAKGMVLELWTVAQKFWLASKGRGIPKPAWMEYGLPQELIDCRLARDDGEFIYAIGSKEQFSWLVSCSEKGKKGGPAAAKARHETKGKSKRQKTSENVTPSSRDDPARALTPSPSPSPSPDSVSSYLFSKGEDANAPAPFEGIRNPVGFFIANYVNAYQQRYGATARPSLAGKVQGQIKRYLSETPTERACEMIRAYIDMNDAWFVTKAHDFGTFIENLTKVGLKLDTGKSSNATQARAEEKIDGTKDQMRRVMEGSL